MVTVEQVPYPGSTGLQRRLRAWYRHHCGECWLLWEDANPMGTCPTCDPGPRDYQQVIVRKGQGTPEPPRAPSPSGRRRG